MSVRVLPRDEQSRLNGLGVPLISGVRPEDAAVVVVEEDRKIVAALTVLRATHFEGVWVDREHKHATRSLLRIATAVAQGHGSEWVFSGATDDRMRDILTRLGAVKLQMDSYMYGLNSESWPITACGEFAPAKEETPWREQ